MVAARPRRARRSRPGWSPTSAASTTACFNALANKGRLDAQKELGADTRVVISDANGDYIPNLTSLAQQQYDIIVSNGFLMADATATVAGKLPDANFAIIDYSAAALKGKPKNVEGLLFKEQEGGYLVGYLAGLWAKDNGAKVVSTVGRPEDSAGRPLHRGLRGRGQEGVPRNRDPERLLAGLRGPGEVQGDRARPDLQGLEGRLPGGRHSAASARSTPRSRRACRESASTPTRPTSATTS